MSLFLFVGLDSDDHLDLGHVARVQKFHGPFFGLYAYNCGARFGPQFTPFSLGVNLYTPVPSAKVLPVLAHFTKRHGCVPNRKDFSGRLRCSRKAAECWAGFIEARPELVDEWAQRYLTEPLLGALPVCSHPTTSRVQCLTDSGETDVHLMMRRKKELPMWPWPENSLFEIVSRCRERARCVYTTYVRSQRGISG